MCRMTGPLLRAYEAHGSKGATMKALKALRDLEMRLKGLRKDLPLGVTQVNRQRIDMMPLEDMKRNCCCCCCCCCCC